MILSKEFYIRVPFLKRLWLKRQVIKLSKSAKLFSPGSWKNYHPSIRSQRYPVFIGTKKELEQISDIKELEAVCPTNALKVTSSEIVINEKNCIGCLECVKASPEGIFHLLLESFRAISIPIKFF